METPFRENKLWSTPLRDLGLKIEGTALEPAIAELRRELDAVGLTRIQPHFYLTTDWVVHDDQIAVGIPFYLARQDLFDLHAEQEGHVEGAHHAELLRYLRHEMGHVVNYAYKLFDREEWVRLFGAMTRPYEDEYRPEPFSRRYVVHLPGWYAQKHPDEDWAETFAVWLTPGQDWRAAYADWPGALGKLELCDRLMREVRDAEPLVTAVDTEWAVGNLEYTVQEHYDGWAFADNVPQLPGIDGALQAIFERLGEPEDASKDERLPADALILRCERDIMADVFRWTGHFPERTRALLRHLAERARALKQVYPAGRERQAVIGLATLAAALAMNHVHRGAYMPEPPG